VTTVESGAVPDSDEYILQAVPFRTVVMDIAGGDRKHAGLRGETRERGDAAGITEDEIVLQLDRDIVPAKPRDVTIEERVRFWPLASVDEAGERATPAAGEKDQAARVVREERRIEAGLRTESRSRVARFAR
jgi:hypothetical protein